MEIRKGDTVQVVSGRDRGKRGEVQRIVRGKYKFGRRKGEHDASKDRVVVAGINLITKHQRPTQQTQQQAGLITREGAIHHSNVMLICPNCDEPTRISVDRSDGSKVRVCKKCGEDIDKR